MISPAGLVSLKHIRPLNFPGSEIQEAYTFPVWAGRGMEIVNKLPGFCPLLDIGTLFRHSYDGFSFRRHSGAPKPDA